MRLVSLGSLGRAPRRIVLVSFDWTRPKDPRVPLGHGSLLASLQAAAVDVKPLVFPINGDVFDADAAIAQVDHTLRGQGPADLAVGVYVWNEPLVQRLISTVRRGGFGGRIILGGPQISYAGRGLEALYPGADVFVRGAGEQALVALARAAYGSPIDGVHWAGLPDVEQVARVDITALPSPYLTGAVPLAERRFARWETKRGCTFRCTFCQHREPGQRTRIAAFALDRIREEAALFVRSGIDDLAVLDPVFNVGADAPAVLDVLRTVGYRGRISLQCHFDALSDAFLDACAGLDVRLEFGLQTIQPAEMRAIARVNRRDRVERGIEALHQRGLPFEVSLIFGLPEQTLASFLDTVCWCLAQRVPVLKAFPLMLLRGTELEQQRGRWGLVEDGDSMPCVVSSHSFTTRDWRAMAAVAAALSRTEGAHPHTLPELLAQVDDGQPDASLWRPTRHALSLNEGSTS